MTSAAKIATEYARTRPDLAPDPDHFFSAAQTNAEVVRKRTADLMKLPVPPIECLGERVDPDGVKRDWYEVKA